MHLFDKCASTCRSKLVRILGESASTCILNLRRTIFIYHSVVQHIQSADTRGSPISSFTDQPSRRIPCRPFQFSSISLISTVYLAFILIQLTYSLEPFQNYGGSQPRHWRKPAGEFVKGSAHLWRSQFARTYPISH